MSQYKYSIDFKVMNPESVELINKGFNMNQSSMINSAVVESITTALNLKQTAFIITDSQLIKDDTVIGIEDRNEPRMIEDLVSINNLLAVIDLSDEFNDHVFELERLYNKKMEGRIGFMTWLNYYIKIDYSSVGFKDKAIAAIRKADELIGKNKIKWEGENSENK